MVSISKTMAPDYRLLFEASPHPYIILRVDPSYTIVAVNDRYSEQLGIHDFVLKDDLARLVPAIQRSLNEIEVHRARRRAEKKLRESEELARQRLAEIEAIYRTAPVGLCVLDTGLKFLRINAQMAEINGMPAEDHIGRTVREILPGMADQVEPLLLSVMQTGLPLRDSEISGETAARPGVLRTWRHSVHPLKTSDGKIIGLNTVIEEITERKKAQEALSALNKELKQRTELAEARARQLNHLAVELIEAEERERRRLSELLHDDLQQTLAAARMHLQAVGQGLASDPLLARVEGLLNEAIGKSRSLSHELSPSVLYHSGLSAALKWIVGQMEERFGLRADLEIGCDQKRCESEPVKVFIFRAAHELLFNVVKHAGVKSAKILLSCPDNQMVLTISDRGRGFNPEELELNTKSGLGLLSLRERARNFGGRLVIDSGPAKGVNLCSLCPSVRPLPMNRRNSARAPTSRLTFQRCLLLQPRQV
ncbi:MAG: PAS domain S-box protein [Desulfobacteraceae bacterium]|nr:MAG: PAS domain S-box protein [Desulfobacteraceae bacterium]